MKNKILNYLKYKFVYCLSVILFFTFLFFAIFQIKESPKYEETINIFIAENIDSTSLAKKLTKEYEGSNIKEVAIDVTNANNYNYNLIFQTRGLTNTDFIIIPKEKIKSGNCSQYYSDFDEKSLSSMLGNNNLSFYHDLGKCYGISLKNYLNCESDLYLFFNKKSEKNFYVSGIGNQDSFLALKCLLENDDNEKK